MKKNKLGRTEIYVTPVGMGTLTMGFSQKNLSIEDGAAIIYHAVSQGINFLDTAEYYDTYRYLRPALDQIREEGLPLPILSSKSLAMDYEGMTKAIRDCLEALALPVIDIFLLHEVRGIEDYKSRGAAWQALQDAKKQGLVRAIGISTHHVDAALEAAQDPACDVVFPLINKSGLGIRNGENPAAREEMESAILTLSQEEKGVYTMKAFGGGNLVEDYVPCLDYASSLPGNTSVMIGMGSLAEVDAAIQYFRGTLPENYTPDTSRKIMMVDQSDCEGCGTCMKRCVSRAISWNERGLAEIDTSRCVHCGYCAPVCPVRAIIFLEKNTAEV